MPHDHRCRAAGDLGLMPSADETVAKTRDRAAGTSRARQPKVPPAAAARGAGQCWSCLPVCKPHFRCLCEWSPVSHALRSAAGSAKPVERISDYGDDLAVIQESGPSI